MDKSKFVRHSKCPKCGSKDNLAIYSNGGEHCFSQGCGYHVNGDTGEVTVDFEENQSEVSMQGVVSAISDRRISKATCELFGVRVEYDTAGNISRHHYPYYSMNTNEVSLVKTRSVENKKFICSGSPTNVGLFGQNVCRGKGKFITITEGELDAMSVSEMFSNKWDVVSLRTGAQGARKDVQENLEFLEGYENVVLCFDTDPAGKSAVDSIKDLFSPNKLKIMTVPSPYKDANEMLVAKDITGFTKAWWDAKAYRPDGIVGGHEMWERLCASNNIKSIEYPWEGLNRLTKGFRRAELVTITSGSGMGKSSVIRELVHHCFVSTEDNIGVISLEETTERTIKGIMSIEAGYPMHLDESLKPEDMEPYYKKIMGSKRFYFFDHWGSTGEDNILSRIRYMAKALECKTIFLDHLAIIVSSQDGFSDERKAIDAIMTKLRTLVQELNVSLFLVSHLRRSSGKSHEEGGSISLNELRGSQAIAQLSDIVVGLERNQQHEDEYIRNTTVVRVLKNRYTGLTGPACYLNYSSDTGRISEVPKPLVDIEDEF